jgi:single-strand DNA-binding protein
MNIWNFTGNIGKDGELKYTNSGEPVCSFSVAVSSGYGDKKKTTWANCSLFGKAASGSLPEYLKKGTQVAVSGELTLDEWQAPDGSQRQALKVRVVSIDLIGSKVPSAHQQDYRGHTGSNQSNPTCAPSSPRPVPAQSRPTPPAPQAPQFDELDDIPFN